MIYRNLQKEKKRNFLKSYTKGLDTTYQQKIKNAYYMDRI